MIIKTYDNLDSLTFRIKFKDLLEKFQRENIYSFTSIFSYIEVLEIYLSTNRINRKNIAIITVENEENELILLIPFVKFNFLNITILKFLGSNKIDYNVCLYSNEFKQNPNQILKEIKDQLSNNFIIIFSTILDTYIIGKLKAQFTYYESFSIDKYSFVELGNFEKNISTKLLKEIKRSERRLNKDGSLIFVDNKNNKKLNNVMDFIINKKNEQYINSGVAKLDESSEKFYRELAKKDISHISAIFHNDKIIAAHLGLKSKSNYTYLLPVYDYKYRKYSPGWILLFKLLETFKLNNLNRFDLTIGEEGYKSRLKPKQGEIFYFGIASNKLLNLLVKLNIIILKIKIKLHKFRIKYLSK